jgi:hypothetical protein
MLHGRERNRAIKLIVANCLSIAPSSVRVQLGKGTAHSWADVVVPVDVGDEKRAEIEAKLVADELVGTYYYDDFSNKTTACVHLRKDRRRP